MYDANVESEIYTGKVVKETDKAKLIDFGEKEPVWIPKSQILAESPQKDSIKFELPIWLAIEKGLE
jgi:hypothetical protein